MRILGIGIGDEVIVPAYTYTATASVVEHVGARLVMIDCEHGKFTMDYEKLEAAITERTKAIIRWICLVFLVAMIRFSI